MDWGQNRSRACRSSFPSRAMQSLIFILDLETVFWAVLDRAGPCAGALSFDVFMREVNRSRVFNISMRPTALLRVSMMWSNLSNCHRTRRHGFCINRTRRQSPLDYGQAIDEVWQLAERTGNASLMAWAYYQRGLYLWVIRRHDDVVLDFQKLTNVRYLRITFNQLSVAQLLAITKMDESD